MTPSRLKNQARRRQAEGSAPHWSVTLRLDRPHLAFQARRHCIPPAAAALLKGRTSRRVW